MVAKEESEPVTRFEPHYFQSCSEPLRLCSPPRAGEGLGWGLSQHLTNDLPLKGNRPRPHLPSPELKSKIGQA